MQKNVYEALGREKRPGESFTVLFRRLLDQHEGLDELAGAWGRAGHTGDRARLNSLRAAPRRRS